jgi:hypothetical protein
MPDPPEDYNICPCCGTEFGYDDESKSFAQLRHEWIVGGMRWFFRQPPPFWDPQLQLAGVNSCMGQFTYVSNGVIIPSETPIYGVSEILMGTESIPLILAGNTYYATDLSIKTSPGFDVTIPIVMADAHEGQQYKLAVQTEKCELAMAS